MSEESPAGESPRYGLQTRWRALHAAVRCRSLEANIRWDIMISQKAICLIKSAKMYGDVVIFIFKDCMCDQ